MSVYTAATVSPREVHNRARRAGWADQLSWLRSEGIAALQLENQMYPEWQLEQLRDLHRLDRSIRRGTLAWVDRKDARHLRLVLFADYLSPLGDFSRWLSDRAETLSMFPADPQDALQIEERAIRQRDSRNLSLRLSPEPRGRPPRAEDLIHYLTRLPGSERLSLDAIPDYRAGRPGALTYRELLASGFGTSPEGLSEELLDAIIDPGLWIDGIADWSDAFVLQPMETILRAREHRDWVLRALRSMSKPQWETTRQAFAGSYEKVSRFWSIAFGLYPTLRVA